MVRGARVHLHPPDPLSRVLYTGHGNKITHLNPNGSMKTLAHNGNNKLIELWKQSTPLDCTLYDLRLLDRMNAANGSHRHPNEWDII